MAGSKSLLSRVYDFEKSRADRLYLTQPMGDGRVDDFSWARALDEARRMATYLRSLDYPPKSQIGIISKNCAHFILTDLAIWMAGHVSVALYPTLNAETVRYILEHSETKLLFVGKLDGWDDMKVGVPEGLPCVSYPLSPPNDFPTWNELIKKHEPLAESPERDADEMAIIIYTSGSTGRPKGVMISFGSMAEASDAIVDVLGTSDQDRMLSYLPMAHAMERWLVECVSLVTGMHVFFAESLETFVQDLKRARPTVFLSVPRLWLKFQLGVFSKMPEEKLNRLLGWPVVSYFVRKKILKGLGLENVRFAGSGSAPIPGELIEWYKKLGLELLEGYGMTENFSYSHVTMPGKARVGYVGNTYPDVECKISKDHEILVKSPGTMIGYFKEPEMTAESFTEDGFLKTGDRGELDEQGRLKITGRVKELFKTSKGKYVAPAPIENLINADSHTELSCVSGNGRPTAYALVVLSEDLRKKRDDAATRAKVTDALETLLKNVNRTIEDHEKLGFLVVVKDEWAIENEFLTPTMKIRRSAIEEAYDSELDGWYDSGKKVIWQ